MLSPLPLLLLAAHASGVDAWRPPAASVAGEDGADATWVNPANLAYDPDASLSLLARQELDPDAQHVALAALLAPGLGMGVRYHRLGDAAPWWGVASGLTLSLPEDIQMGIGTTWNFPGDGRDSFLSWDLGLAWRPLPSLGFGGTVRNIGNPAPEDGVFTTWRGGVLYRPWERLLELGLDLEAQDTASDLSPGRRQVILTARSRPVEGLVLRAEIAQDVELEAPPSIGGGLELAFGGPSVGAWVGESGNAWTAGLRVENDHDRLYAIKKDVVLVDLDVRRPYQASEGLLAVPQETWLRLVRRMQRAARDRNVRGMVVMLGDLPLSMAQVQEMRAILQAASDSGRPVVAWLRAGAGANAYLLATAADRVLVHPAADLHLVGLSLELQYFKGTMDLLGIETQVARRSEYKSAPEAQTRTSPSEPAREAFETLLDDLYANLLETVAADRARTPEEISAIIDRGPFTAREALDAGLVDGLAYRDELEEGLGDLFGRGYELEEDYRRTPVHQGWEARRKIAVIYVEGTIVPGTSSGPGLLSGPSTGSDTVIAQLDEAARDDRVKAVLLRVDSPGGSSYASDEIWRAVRRVRDKGKPVVVSMGGMAASGGYYVSCGADHIVAEPTTITGSIGVYATRTNFAGLYERAGVDTTLLTRGRMAAIDSPSRPLDPVEFDRIDQMVEATYEQFKQRVAEGRGLDPDEVEAVARGRVWSGARALDSGLVDELGGIEEALAAARRLAGLRRDDGVELVSYGGGGGLFGNLKGEKLEDGAAAGLGRALLRVVATTWVPATEAVPPAVRQAATLARLADEPVLALLPWRIEVR